MRREPALFVGAALALGWPVAHAQKLTLQPAIDVMGTATTNASPTNEAPRKDLVINVSPELSGSYEGARSRIDGHIRVDNVHYARNSQPDKTLPTGDLVMRSNVLDQWGGVDAALQTQQIANPLDPSRFPDSYTSTTARLVPFIQHAFDANTRLKAQLERSVIKSSETAIQTQYFSRQAVRLERSPTPVGSSLEWKSEETEVSGLSTVDKRSAVRGGLTYALNEEVFAGIVMGQGSTRSLGSGRQNDTIRGVLFSWHPSERIALDSRVEHRYYGTGWRFDLIHRTKSMALSITSERDASTYASTAENLGSSIPTERVQTDAATSTPGEQARNELARRQLQPLQALYTLTPTLRQTLQGRIVWMGRRDTLSLIGGMDKNGALTRAVSPSLVDQVRFLELQYNHLLTPSTTLGTGVRWRQTEVIANQGLPGNLLPIGTSRDVTWRGDISTRLSTHATATVGFRHQMVDSTQVNAGDESAIFVGLGYRY